ncbi:hypothetical protein [Hyalangium sp.]|uniref:hypothetical protein n=1 Tax=Hyalangium sp. TaxID=2028555 RepID=UPI002D5685A7|nr:hypothetical protein [Hyalangium sp.]HYI00374.1 hypothetical protein [Hyalangium sp.]
MICIRCQADSTYPERKDTKSCKQCNGRFAFEPRENDPFTDVAFQKAIDSVSAGGQVKWGVEHLYYEICRRKKSIAAKAKASITALVFGIIVSVIALELSRSLLPFLIPVPIVLCFLAYMMVGARMFPRGDFERLWDRWGSVHGKPKGLIARKPQEAKPARTAEPDIGDYSFDRAVVCDRARTVDLLLANNFHFENNCAVLSIGGYPQQAFETVRRMLRRNPRLEVFVLHDITVEGCRLAHRLATDPEWFKGTGVRIVDVGLRPAHARPFEKLLLPADRPVPSGGGLSAEEARWLSKHTLELAVIRPEQVVKRLFRAMSKTPQVARAPAASLRGRDTQGRLPGGAGRAAAAGAAGAAVMASTAAMAGPQDPAELERQKKKQADTGGGDGGGGGGGDSGSSWEVDSDSFSADADASDGGADSFG